ncbi:MAG: LptF/LptG family permease [Saprospiraceae bacterium]
MNFLFGRLKKIDRMLISAFIPPMVLSFLIALFVLTMQFFWLYIDEIMGKGVGFFQIIELISYLTVSFVPLALPMGVLLASVMVFGNMGERYELSSIKSAGISLIRIMLPLVFLTLFISIISYAASNYVIPKANLKFLTRLYDIRRQKPALAIEEGVFNDDFYGYSIFVGKKQSDKNTIENVIIYDQNKASDLLKVTRANRGKMYTTDKGKRFVMELYNGEEVEEQAPQYKEGGRKNYPLMRTRFDKYIKSFDLEEFEINNTDENRFSDNQKMLTNGQLLVQIDTIDKQIQNGEKKVGLGVSKLFDTAFSKKLDKPVVQDSFAIEIPDTTDIVNDSIPVDGKIPSEDSVSKKIQVKSLQAPKINLATIMIDSINKARGVVSSFNQSPESQDSIVLDLQALQQVNHFYELIRNDKKARLFKETGSAANLVQSEIINVLYTLRSFKKKQILYWQQFYQKFTLALACLIFLFIGSSMGAIVRKGGFGYPLLIAIIFFIVYIMASKMFEKLTDSFVLPVGIGMWLTSLLLGIVGIFLTYRASKDMSSNFMANALEIIGKWFEKRRAAIRLKRERGFNS